MPVKPRNADGEHGTGAVVLEDAAAAAAPPEHAPEPHGHGKAAKEKAPQVTLRPAQWDVESVTFRTDPEDPETEVTIAQRGYAVNSVDADALKESAARAGFALTQEGSSE
jgi:hypothetical protein